MATSLPFVASCVACSSFTARPCKMRDGALMCQPCARFMRRVDVLDPAAAYDDRQLRDLISLADSVSA